MSNRSYKNLWEDKQKEAFKRAEQARSVFYDIYGSHKYVSQLVKLVGDIRWQNPNISFFFPNMLFTLGRGNGQTCVAMKTLEMMEKTRSNCFQDYQSIVEYHFDSGDEYEWYKFEEFIEDARGYKNRFEGLCALDITALGSFTYGITFRNLMEFIRKCPNSTFLMYVDPEDNHVEQLIEQVNRRIHAITIRQPSPSKAYLASIVLEELEKYNVYYKADESKIKVAQKFSKLSEFKKLRTIQDAIQLARYLAWRIPGLCCGKAYSVGELYMMVSGKEAGENKVEEGEACTVNIFPNRKS